MEDGLLAFVVYLCRSKHHHHVGDHGRKIGHEEPLHLEYEVRIINIE
jgi:hypothetical protein